MRMHELEKTLVEIYELFSEKFPDHDNLWQVLIKEEQEHAEAVRKLYQMTYQKEVLFDEGNLKADAVQTIIDYIKGICEVAKQGKLTAIQALQKAHDIETSLIERDLFRHFRVSPQFVDMLRFLHEGSQGHIQLTKTELEKAQRKLKKHKG